jgi:hypothetical protein
MKSAPGLQGPRQDHDGQLQREDGQIDQNQLRPSQGSPGVECAHSVLKRSSPIMWELIFIVNFTFCLTI